jgi:hypothetical protein
VQLLILRQAARGRCSVEKNITDTEVQVVGFAGRHLQQTMLKVSTWHGLESHSTAVATNSDNPRIIMAVHFYDTTVAARGDTHLESL